MQGSDPQEKENKWMSPKSATAQHLEKVSRLNTERGETKMEPNILPGLERQGSGLEQGKMLKTCKAK